MTKRLNVGITYFIVVLLTLLLRVASALDIYSALGVEDADALFTCIVQIAIFGFVSVSGYFLSAHKRGESAKIVAGDFGVRKVSWKNWLLIVPMCICAIAVSSGISLVWQIVLRMMGFTHISSPTDYSSVGVLFKELVLVAVLPGVFEEVAHRGLIYAGYKESKWKFVLVSALLFSLMHQNIVQTGYTFFFGATIALMMYYTGSIWPGIVLHIANNGFSVISGYIDQNGGAFSFIATIQNWLYSSTLGLLVGALLVIICAGLLVLFFFLMRKNCVKEERISQVPFALSDDDVTRVHKDIPFILTVAVGVVATLFSFVWGMMR